MQIYWRKSCILVVKYVFILFFFFNTCTVTQAFFFPQMKKLLKKSTNLCFLLMQLKSWGDGQNRNRCSTVVVKPKEMKPVKDVLKEVVVTQL